MKFNKALAAALLMSASVPSIASNFEGFFIEAGAQYTKADSDIGDFSAGGVPLDITVSGDGSDTNPTLALGYTFKVSDKIFIGASYERVMTDISLGSQNIIADGVVEGDTINIDVEDAQSLVVSPSYALSDKTLAALRLGYTEATSHVFDQEVSTKTDISGVLFGASIQHFFSDNLYVKGILDYHDFKDERVNDTVNDETFNLDVSATKFNIAIGYRF